MDEFIRLFLKWNERINLSAARSREEVEEHIQDSLAVVPHLHGQVLDVGSGGGFPVVIAAMNQPHATFVALEPNHKKHAFLREAARVLSLVHLDARCERLEDHAQRNYDVAMSRATWELPTWLSLGSKYVRSGGSVLGFEAIPRSDLPENVQRHRYQLGHKQRAIVELRVTGGNEHSK
jgi:16S rRNA (guanine527-N7)-methyltransferase